MLVTTEFQIINEIFNKNNRLNVFKNWLKNKKKKKIKIHP